MKTIDELKAEIENLTHELRYNEHMYSGDSDTKDRAIEMILEKRYPNIFSKHDNDLYKLLVEASSDVYRKYMTKYDTEICDVFDELVETGKRRKTKILNEISAIERQIKIEGIIE